MHPPKPRTFKPLPAAQQAKIDEQHDDCKAVIANDLPPPLPPPPKKKEDFATENQDKVKALLKTATALGMVTSAASSFRATAKFNVLVNFDD